MTMCRHQLLQTVIGVALMPGLVQRGLAEQTEADDFRPALWDQRPGAAEHAVSGTGFLSTEQDLPVDRFPQTVWAESPVGFSDDRPWTWQVLPDGLLFKTYLAGLKESRFSTAMLYDHHREGWLWDSTLGGRVGILRYGTPGSVRPEGFQLDLEGAALVRLDVEQQDDLEAADFRFATPFTWAWEEYSVRFGYYHISSHLGDEFMIRNPDVERLNYVRDGILLGISVDVTDDVRVYSEAGWAFSADGGARPWEFQFGSEYSPARANLFRPTPYAAINGHLRQELGFGGNLNFLAGWQWRGFTSDRLYRFGLQYTNGKSAQYSFYNRFEQLTGIGFWFDY